MVTDVVERVAVPAAPPVSARAQASSRVRLESLAVALAPLLGIGFFLVTSWMAFVRHDVFLTGRFDLEIYTQVVWNTATDARSRRPCSRPT